jgi:IS5 family transposase
MMSQLGIFESSFAYGRLDKCTDPLLKLNEAIDWSMFRSQLESIRRNEHVGRKAFDVLMMFKILILQSLYNLADDAMEYMLRDRLSFMRFLGLSLTEKIPDAKTIWKFREQLTESKLIRPLFDKFEEYLKENGFEAKKGQIIDATIIETPVQHNSDKENERIKDEEVPDEWGKAKASQKDVDARWTKKGNKSYYGYKDHINVDVEHKIIRQYEVTPANVHDSQAFEKLVELPETEQREGSTEGESTERPRVYADSAYSGEKIKSYLEEKGIEAQICSKGNRGKVLNEEEKRKNREKSRIRCRVEHVFGSMYQKARDHVMRSIGMARAKTQIGLRNLVYNMTRYSYLCGIEGHRIVSV